MNEARIEEEDLAAASDLRLLLDLFPLVRPHIFLMTVSLLLLPVVSACRVGGTYLIKICLDTAIVPSSGGDLILPIGAFFVVLALENGARFAHAYILQMAGHRLLFDLRQRLFNSMSRAPMSYHDKNPTGRLLTRITSDVDAVNDMFASGAIAIVGDAMTVVAVLVAMFWLDSNLAKYVLFYMPVLCGILYLIRKHLKEVYNLTRTKLASMNAYLAEMLHGMDVVKVSRRESVNLSQFDAINQEYRDGYYRSNFLEAALTASVELLCILATATVLWTSSGAIVRCSMTFGTLVAFLRYIDDLFRPLNDISSKFSIIQSALVATAKIFEVLNAPRERWNATLSTESVRESDSMIDPDVPDTSDSGEPGGGEEQHPKRGHLVLDGVTFGYGTDPNLFEGLSLDIRSGERIGIVGYTGAGKTSIAKILTGLYPLRGGSIRLDGNDVSNIGLDDLRRRIVYLPQDHFIFSGSLIENVTLGRDVDHEHVIAALESLGARHLIDRLENGVDTVLLERGANLSTGEKQLISFARVLILDPCVLILDEATSSLDSFLEQRVKDALLVVTSDRTTLTIAHRLATIRDADRIIVLEGGRVSEEGHHQGLLNCHGLYARLWALQGDSAPLERLPEATVVLQNS